MYVHTCSLDSNSYIHIYIYCDSTSIKRDNESAPVTTPEQCALFGELDPVPVCFLQLVGKQYPLKAVSHTKKKKRRSGRRRKLFPSLFPLPISPCFEEISNMLKVCTAVLPPHVHQNTV